jgi:hypothetical protein
MPEHETTTWDDLSDGVKQIVRWALAIEQRTFVGTRALLAGIARSEPPDNPVDTLLRHFDVSREALYGALAGTSDSRIYLQITSPSGSDALPALTDNARVALAEGLALQRRLVTGQSLTASCLFAGLLTNPRSTAALGLQNALGVAAARIQENYVAYLEGTNGAHSYAAHLRATLPRPAGDGPSPIAAPVEQQDPWKALMVVRAASGPIRLGLRTSSATVLTASFPQPVADISARVENDESSSPISYQLVAANDDSALFRRASEPETDRTTTSVRLDLPVLGKTCEFACVNQQSVKVSRRSGVLRQLGASDAIRFAIEDAGEPTSDVAVGSPVVVEGAVVGMVEAAPLGMLRCISTAATDLFAPDGLSRVMAGSVGGAGSDTVGEVDQLGFVHYVEAFADLICSVHTQPPLTIGIFGSWGSGKSFLLQHIERAIAARQAHARPVPHVHVVRFNAWEYSATEVMWPGLVRKILNKVDEDVPYTWPRKMWTRVKWNLPREVRRARPQLIALLLVATAAVIATEALSKTGLAAVIGAAAAIGLGIGGVVKAANKPVAQWLTGVFADADYGRQLGHMEQIRHDLETLEARLHRGANAAGPVERRVLVLIDDLDRCEPAKAVEVLQAVNLLLNFKSFVVCLGIDARVVTSAIEAHYDGLLSKAGVSGYEYLDKIVQIPFTIPAPGEPELKAYVAEQLGVRPAEEGGRGRIEPSDPPPAPAATQGLGTPPRPTETPDGRAGVSSATSDPTVWPSTPPTAEVPFTAAERSAFEQLAPFMRPNPRHVKRLVNVYRLVRSLARSQGDTVVLERPGATIRWLIMWAQWPYLSTLMMRRYDLMVKNGIGRLAGDPMLRLLEEAKAEIEGTLRPRLDDGIPELEALLSVGDCAFVWEQFKAVRRYTVNFNPAVEAESVVLEGPAVNAAPAVRQG